MGKIIQFPLKFNSEAIKIESIIRDNLTNSGIPDDIIESILTPFREKLTKLCDKSFVLKYTLPPLPGINQNQIDDINTSIQDGINDFVKQLHDYNSMVLIELFNLQAELVLNKEQ